MPGPDVAIGRLFVDVSVECPHERMVGAHDYMPVFRFPAVQATAALPADPRAVLEAMARLHVGHSFTWDPAGGSLGVILFQMPRGPGGV